MTPSRKLSFMILTHALMGALHLVSSRPSSLLTFEKHRPVVTASAGEDVVLNCKAEGTPSPILHWERNGKKIQQGIHIEESDFAYKLPVTQEDDDVSSRGAVAVRKLKMSSTRARLYLDCVSPEEAGEYTCVASIPDYTLETSTIVQVEPSQSRQSCLNNRMQKAKSARIYMWTVSRLEYEGEAVQLFCRVLGSPDPEVLWLDPKGKLIENTDNYQLMKNGDLLIRKVRWSQNMGFYRCVAKNEESTDEVTTFLYPIAS